MTRLLLLAALCLLPQMVWGQPVGGTSFDLATTRLVSSGGIYHHQGNYSHASNNSFNARNWYAVPYGASGLRAIFANYQGTSESNGGKTITLTAAFQKQDGTIVPITVNGSSTFSIAVGETLVTDQMSITVAPGEFVAVRCYGTVATPGGWPQGILGSNTWGGSYADWWEVGVDLTDKSQSGTYSGTFAYAFNALGVTSDNATNHAVALFGDSIASAQADTDINSRFAGFWGRSYNKTTAADAMPNLRMSVPGQAMNNTVTKRVNLAKCCTAIACQLGVNDYQQSLATMQSRHASLMTALSSAGKPIVRMTLTPRCNSNNTVDANSTKIISFNDWLATQSDFNALISPAAGLHPSTPDGTWVDGTTYHSDGIHPNAAGHTLYAAAMPTRDWWTLAPTLTSGSITIDASGLTADTTSYNGYSNGTLTYDWRWEHYVASQWDDTGYDDPDVGPAEFSPTPATPGRDYRLIKIATNSGGSLETASNTVTFTAGMAPKVHHYNQLRSSRRIIDNHHYAIAP